MPTALKIIFALASGIGLVAAADSPDDSSHRAGNPVYAQLVPQQPSSQLDQTQLEQTQLTGDLHLPPPEMVDGLSAADQLAVLRRIAGDRYAVSDLLRPSVVAPQVLKLDRKVSPDGDTITQRMHLGFAARGDLDALVREEFLASLVPVEDRSTTTDAESREQADELTPEQFSVAGLDPGADVGEHERYRRFESMLLDRIQLQGVIRAFWTRTDDSILFAAIVDDRFAADDELRPTWQRFQRESDGRLAAAESGPFAGAGIYIKITRLREPAGYLFFEAQGVLLESQAWFDGANLLGSKLPPAIQAQVRDIRRTAIRAADEGGNGARLDDGRSDR